MMKRTTVGLLALVAASAFACGDDDNNSSSNGAAGSTAGAGGQGMGTAGTDMGSAGTPMGTAGSDTPAAAACTSCVELAIPFTAADQSALYQFNNSPPVDFTAGSVTWRVQVIGGSDTTFLKPQLQNGPDQDYAGFYDAPVLALNTTNFPEGTWVEVRLDATPIPAVAEAEDSQAVDAGPDEVADAGAPPATAEDAGAPDASPAAPPPAAGGFDKSLVEAVQLQVGSNAQFTGTADVTVLIDSVTFTGVNGLDSVTFAMGVSGLALNNYTDSPTPAGTPEVVHNP